MAGPLYRGLFPKRWSAVATVAMTKELRSVMGQKNHHVSFGKSRANGSFSSFSVRHFSGGQLHGRWGKAMRAIRQLAICPTTQMLAICLPRNVDGIGFLVQRQSRPHPFRRGRKQRRAARSLLEAPYPPARTSTQSWTHATRRCATRRCATRSQPTSPPIRVLQPEGTQAPGLFAWPSLLPIDPALWHLHLTADPRLAQGLHMPSTSGQKAGSSSSSSGVAPLGQRSPVEYRVYECKHQGCTTHARDSTQFCIAHGGGWRCQREGCTTAAQGRKFCSGHGGGPRCQQLNCSKGAQHPSDYCVRHGGGRRCQTPNCLKSSAGGGHCKVRCPIPPHPRTSRPTPHFPS